VSGGSRLIGRAAAHHQLEHGVRILAESLKAAFTTGLRSAAAAPQGGIEVGFGGLGPVEMPRRVLISPLWPANRSRGPGQRGQGVGAEAASDYTANSRRKSARLSARCRRPGALSSAPSPCKQGAAAERSEVKVSNFRPPGFPDQVTDPPRAAKTAGAVPGHFTAGGRTPPAIARVHRGGLAGQGAEKPHWDQPAPGAKNPDCAGPSFGGLLHKIAGLLQAAPDRAWQGTACRPRGWAHRCARSGQDRFEKLQGMPERICRRHRRVAVHRHSHRLVAPCS